MCAGDTYRGPGAGCVRVTLTEDLEPDVCRVTLTEDLEPDVCRVTLTEDLEPDVCRRRVTNRILGDTLHQAGVRPGDTFQGEDLSLEKVHHRRTALHLREVSDVSCQSLVVARQPPVATCQPPYVSRHFVSHQSLYVSLSRYISVVSQFPVELLQTSKPIEKPNMYVQTDNTTSGDRIKHLGRILINDDMRICLLFYCRHTIQEHWWHFRTHETNLLLGISLPLP